MTTNRFSAKNKINPVKSISHKKPSVIVIGGGFAGVETALKLADMGFLVRIIEKNSDLLLGASNHTASRVGIGTHYAGDLKSAVKYLHESINTLKKYPGFICSNDKDPLHPRRRWRYYITKNYQDIKSSSFSVEHIREVYAGLKAEYKRLVDLDESNKVFGEVDKFIQELGDPAKLNDPIQKEAVETVFEVAEQVLNWPELREHLLNKIKHHPNITVHTNSTVQSFQQSPASSSNASAPDMKFTVDFKTLSANCANWSTLSTDYIVNASWEQIELLNYKAMVYNDYTQHDLPTKRLKGLIEIELPEELAELDEQNGLYSMFFGIGAHCSLTNVGLRKNSDGKKRAMLSYEPVTNISNSSSLQLSPLEKKFIYHEPEAPSEEEKLEFARKILQGAGKYIPALANPDIKVVSSQFGIVINYGPVNIFDQNSSIHKRSESGVEEKAIGLIANKSMKLFYAPRNAEDSYEIIKAQMAVTDFITTIAQLVSERVRSIKYPGVIKQSLSKYLQRNFLSNDNYHDEDSRYKESKSKQVHPLKLKDISLMQSQNIKNQITQTVENKLSLSEEIKATVQLVPEFNVKDTDKIKASKNLTQGTAYHSRQRQSFFKSQSDDGTHRNIGLAYPRTIHAH